MSTPSTDPLYMATYCHSSLGSTGLGVGIEWRVMAATPLTFDCVGLGGLGPRSTQRGWHLVSWPCCDIFCMDWVGFGTPPTHRGLRPGAQWVAGTPLLHLPAAQLPAD